MRPVLLAMLACATLLSACQAPDEPSDALVEPSAGEATSTPVTPPPQEDVADPTPPSATPAPMPTPTPGAEPGSCLAEIGDVASARLVERCIRVSPATRPPCNAANPCQMIQGEIDRACGAYGPDETRPAECAS